jgi:hypothetical protein
MVLFGVRLGYANGEQAGIKKQTSNLDLAQK